MWYLDYTALIALASVVYAGFLVMSVQALSAPSANADGPGGGVPPLPESYTVMDTE